ncbi:MAG: DUF2213 domain-containing protein [Blastomonas sp.]
MFVQDALTVDRTWETTDGFLGFSARFARTGIQHYLGCEIDPSGQHLNDKGERRFQADKLYPVYRDPAEVFSRKAMGSFVAKPITNDHPSTGVNSSNWSYLAKGAIGEVLRDGEYARMSGLITDAATIADYRSGKRELSGGYQTQLIVADGVSDKGEAFVARQTAIDGNHCALVDRGRAGPECRIADAAICDSLPRSFLDSLTVDGTAAAIGWLEKAIALHRKHMSGKAPTTGDAGEKSQQLMMEQMENALSELKPSANKTMKMDQLNTQEKPVKKIVLDGLQVDLSDADAVSAAFVKLQDKASAAETALADAQGKLSTVTGEKAALEAKLADAAKAAEPAALDKLVADRAALIGKAKAAKPDIVTDGKTDADIRKEIVVAKLGDAAASMDDAAISGAFAVLSADAASTVHNIGAPSNPTASTANIRDAARRFRNA